MLRLGYREYRKEARSKKQDFVGYCRIHIGRKLLKLTISPVGTTSIKSYNHDKYSRLEPSQGFNPARVRKKSN